MRNFSCVNMLYFRDETIEIAGKADIVLNAGNPSIIFMENVDLRKEKKKTVTNIKESWLIQRLKI